MSGNILGAVGPIGLLFWRVGFDRALENLTIPARFGPNRLKAPFENEAAPGRRQLANRPARDDIPLSGFRNLIRAFQLTQRHDRRR